MRSFLAVLLVLCLASPAAARVESGQVRYVGGTIPDLKEGTIGRLNTTDEQALVFEAGGNRVEIPYDKIQSFNYTREVKLLGALATIAVVLVKRLRRSHYVEITYQSANGVAQAAVFEVSKEQVKPVMATLNARCKQALKLRPASYRPYAPAGYPR